MRQTGVAATMAGGKGELDASRVKSEQGETYRSEPYMVDLIVVGLS